MAEKSFAVIGLGDFGLALTKELLLLRQQVIAIDKSIDQIQRIGSDLPSAFVVDSTKGQALKDGGVPGPIESIRGSGYVFKQQVEIK